MTFFEQLMVAWQSLRRGLMDLRRGTLWLPLLALGAAEIAVVALLWEFAHPTVSWFMAPLLLHLAGPSALHYPNVFRFLPGLYAQAEVVIGALLGSVAIGAATVLFAARHRGLKPNVREAFALAVRRAGTLIAVNLPFNLLVVVLSYGLEAWMANRSSGGMVRRFGYVVILSGSVVLQSLFLYVTAMVAVDGYGVRDALLDLPRTWARGFWAALTVGAVLVLPLLPLQMLAARSSALVDRGRPELVGWLVLTQVAMELVVWFLLAGSATLLYLSLVAEPEPERAV